MNGSSIEYSETELNFIRHHRTWPRKDLTWLFNRAFGRNVSEENIKALCHRKGWKTGRNGQFEKGKIPWNKGLSVIAGGNSEKTRFKTGNRPKSWVPIGTEVMDRDGYLKRKIRDNASKGMSRKNWKYVHVIKWEEYHQRPLPPKHVIRFKDGNKHNFNKENLVLVSMAENAVINRWLATHGIPPEGFDAILTLARLRSVAYRRRNECQITG